MDKIWAYMQNSNAYERHHIIAIVRAMAKGYVHVDLQLTGGATHKLQALGLTIVKLQGATHRVAWGDIGFENDDAGYIPSQNELHQNPKRKKSNVVKAYERKSEEAAWLRYTESLGLSGENKNGIGRVEK